MQARNPRHMDIATKQWLLALARKAIETALKGEPLVPKQPPRAARERRASFVTLLKHGELRGCIGSLVAHRTLAEDVIANARAAAFHDPRFPPVTAAELPALTIEISVLSSPQRITFTHPAQLIGKGVIITHGHHTATFLPSVWEQLPSPEQFLSHLCVKAGLPPEEWRRGTLTVETYTAEKFSTSKFSTSEA
ncbi:AmmeMemoRadiSam system protein A [Candidatus Woesearchaeota archaeon]|nr:MAG: AmmeMemoRadiSam system protein A [Candidatus Woesearchaeota archaeon]